MLIQNISDVSMRRCNFAEYVFHTWPKTSCFSTPRLVTRMKTGLTLRMYKMSDWYSFLPPLTLVLLLHDHKFPWQEHVHDRLLLKHQNCTVEIAPNMLWPFGFSSSFALQISKDMIPLRTSKLQKLLVSSYLMALSGPVCVCESCYHMQAQTHIHTYFNPWSESRAGGHGSIHQSVANEATDVWRGYAVWSTARTCESNCWFLFLYDAVCFKKEFHISYCLLYYLH